jgi:hypothetical protein
LRSATLTDSGATSKDCANDNDGKHAEAKSAAEKIMRGMALFIAKYPS